MRDGRRGLAVVVVVGDVGFGEMDWALVKRGRERKVRRR